MSKTSASTTKNRIAFSLPHDRNSSAGEMLKYAVLADELNYDTVFVPESWHRDAFTTLGMIAAQTKKIRLGPGIINIFSRTPTLIAQSIATLDEMSEGRAILGIGISGPIVIENWHGISFKRALRRTKETVEIIRLALEGKQVDYSGEIFQLRGFRLGFTPIRSDIPIFLASIGPRNNSLTGEIADGWLPIWLPLEGFSEAKKEVGRINEIAPHIITCVGDDISLLRNLVRPHLAYYVGGMGTFYRNVISRFGFRKEANNIFQLWQTSRRRDAVAAIPDEMIDRLAAIGSSEECRRRLDEYRAAGATLPVLVLPQGATQLQIEVTMAEAR